MDRDAFTTAFSKDDPRGWACPRCDKGVLTVMDGTFHRDELRDSRDAHDHDAWDPDWIDFVYACLFQCTNPSCKEIISSCGRGSVNYVLYYDENGETQGDAVERFWPLHFHPHLKLFRCPANTPDAIASRLDSSFRVFFGDPPAALMHLRTSVEELLTHLGIRRSEVVDSRNGKRKAFVSLHRRIELLPEKHKDLSHLLLAVKWLGNAGSHSGNEVTSSDVLDAYDLVSAALTMVFDPKATAIAKLAKRINKTRGRKKKPRLRNPLA